MNPTTTLKREVATYIALAYALSTAICVALPHANINKLLLMFVPTIAVAIVTITVTPRGHRRELWGSLGLKRAGIRTWPSAVLVPVLLCAGAFGTAIAVGAGRLQVDPGSADVTSASTLVISFVISISFVLGEEIGWRGFLLPRMQQLVPDRRRAALATGFVHGCFHLPLIVIGTTYDNEVSAWLAAPAAVALITAGGVFYAWLWDRSHSVWPVAIAHNTVNTVFELGALAVVAKGGANVAAIAGETGVATVGVVVVLAAVLWRRAGVWHTPDVPSEQRPVVVTAA
jgi:membrane protease YdiL (CAAX protease family)